MWRGGDEMRDGVAGRWKSRWAVGAAIVLIVLLASYLAKIYADHRARNDAFAKAIAAGNPWPGYKGQPIKVYSNRTYENCAVVYYGDGSDSRGEYAVLLRKDGKWVFERRSDSDNSFDLDDVGRESECRTAGIPDADNN